MRIPAALLQLVAGRRVGHASARLQPPLLVTHLDCLCLLCPLAPISRLCARRPRLRRVTAARRLQQISCSPSRRFSASPGVSANCSSRAPTCATTVRIRSRQRTVPASATPSQGSSFPECRNAERPAEWRRQRNTAAARRTTAVRAAIDYYY